MTGETERDWLEGNDSRTQHEEMTGRPSGRCAVTEALEQAEQAAALQEREGNEGNADAIRRDALRATLASPCCLGDSQEESSSTCGSEGS